MVTSAYSVETRWGGSEDAPPAERLAEIVAELAVPDEEHPDTWLSHHASGWTLRLDEQRFAYLEDHELNTVRHMAEVTLPQALDLWLRFSKGGPAAVNGDVWVAGPRIQSSEELEAIRERGRLLTLESDRQFFESLGVEDPSRQCKHAGCVRGTVKYSVLCAAHHFEQIRGKPYPLSPELRGDA